MTNLTRFGMSLNSQLLEKFDQLIKKQGYSNRSEAIRDLIRDKLIDEEWEKRDAKTIGVFSLVYDHHQRDLSKKLTQVQHQYTGAIVSSTHIHIDHDNCLEVIILKGKSSEIRAISNELQSIKGVKHGKLIMTTTGVNIS